MYYLDANAFIYRTLYDGEKVAGARTRGGPRDGDRPGTAFARAPEPPHSRRRRSHLLQAITAMDTYDGISPRDAIHYAVMTDRGIFAIASDDRDFDGLTDVERQPLESFGDGDPEE